MIARIQEIIEKENTNPSAFADEIGISRGAMNHILNGRNKPSLDVLMKIITRYKNINLEWLIQGTMPMYKTERSAFQASLFEENPVNEDKSTDEIKYAKEIEDKKPNSASKLISNQSFMQELSLSENIDKIIIFFKNKTFITLRPED